VAGPLGFRYWYSSLNVDGPCIHDGVRGVSTTSVPPLNGSIKVLGIPLAGDEVRY